MIDRFRVQLPFMALLNNNLEKSLLFHPAV